MSRVPRLSYRTVLESHLHGIFRKSTEIVDSTYLSYTDYD